jgi:acyl-[acyl-carrier-protein] desaturase
LGGQEWDTEQSRLSDVARVAMVTNLLTEDNLPSYQRTIAEYLSIDDAWGRG